MSRHNTAFLPKPVLYHLRILLGGVAITLFFNLLWSGDPTTNFLLSFLLVVVQLEIFMVIARKIFPRRLGPSDTGYRKNLIVRLVIFFLIVFLIASVFMVITTNPTEILAGRFPALPAGWRVFLISWIIAIGLASTAFFYIEWTHALDRERQLREEKLIFRYETLKNQVNPHFLFNCLNTLSELIPKDPALSDRFINRLAAIYRYVLEYADRQWVSLSDELGFVRDHFFLQQVRDGGKVQIEIQIDQPAGYMLLPISLQMLVENAVKHNIATQESPLYIRIYLGTPDVLIIENNVQRRTVLRSSKIGLKNLAERVRLAMQQDLVIEEDSGVFRVRLPIMKSSHERADH